MMKYSSGRLRMDPICITKGNWQDFRPLASTVTVPVLFFVGRYDRAVGPESYKDLNFPNGIIRVGDCGHFPFLESPEEWSRALDDFLHSNN